MNVNEEAERVARIESLFREVNERIAETAERFETRQAEFVCECHDATCTERIPADLNHYEEVRDNGARFIVANGHEDDSVEQVVEERDTYRVVEKDDPQVEPLVRNLDPRH